MRVRAGEEWLAVACVPVASAVIMMINPQRIFGELFRKLVRNPPSPLVRDVDSLGFGRGVGGGVWMGGVQTFLSFTFILTFSLRDLRFLGSLLASNSW